MIQPPDGQPVVEAEAATRRGYSHAYNEDAYLVSVDAHVFAVADGMGGHRDGHRASNLVVSALAKKLERPAAFEDRILASQIAIEEANAALHSEAVANPALGISGSTVVALVVGEGYACCLWVGDSRLYLMRSGRLYLISEDHAAVSGALTRAVGSAGKVAVERRLVELSDGDVFLLCSDGLLKGMTEETLIDILAGGGENVADRLLAKSVAGGSTDDITLVLVWVYSRG
ncbi:serine/threonine protein phosphatase PrpC [Pseudorhizobium tarimense]|uniref:Serine/threonine protein phosphatase PrpC n=1 Tax=Pseudorhizobium tarimense TaxID=1079109 RepID=A0ABV2H455_9HYPH|nr:protein phosphatase 2C domain-containing protein [Pseudorhizobium tarimense]MCJ8518550.1 protein phosphatase 2C domain-containing protein [Pseudorhizobium tarimense]